jgi:hypothetical protein
MSSFSTAYIVAPNVPAGTATLIPNPTKLNGTDPIIDLIPQIIKNEATPTPVALSNTIGSTTTLYTAPSGVSAGTYLVSANFRFETTSGSWSASEAMICDIANTDAVGLVTLPVVTLRPGYVSYFPSATEPINLTVTGLLELSSSGTITCRVTRAGAGITSNKTGAINSLTVQKIA